ncbi:uncharacterized protein [Acropora muricata]|uniref:uncharacterized protein isoform X1 n=2 Tax=Acropora muricata TaxID=159855 RepID=UPI0034E3DF27
MHVKSGSHAQREIKVVMADNSGARTYKRGYKYCSECGHHQPISRQVCGNESCKSPFPKRKKDMDAIKNMGKTSITQQRNLMEKRADILHLHHGCDVVLLIHHKYASGDTLSFYGTEGAGVSFIGNKNDKQTSEAGQLVLKLFRKSVEDYKAANKKSVSPPVPSTSQSNLGTSSTETSPSPACGSQGVNSSGSEVVPPSSHQSLAFQSTESVTPSNLGASSIETSPSPACGSQGVHSSGSKVIPPSPHQWLSFQSIESVTPSNLGISPIETSPSPACGSQGAHSSQSEVVPPSPHQSLSFQCTESENMVVYFKNSTIVAGGRVQTDREMIHGCRIPPGHVCVMLTTAHPNHAAPLILGDKLENSVLEKGKFFALPTKSLMTAKLTSDSNKPLVLTPYVSSR